jgi:hypothetical protein
MIMSVISKVEQFAFQFFSSLNSSMMSVPSSTKIFLEDVSAGLLSHKTWAGNFVGRRYSRRRLR